MEIGKGEREKKKIGFQMGFATEKGIWSYGPYRRDKVHYLIDLIEQKKYIFNYFKIY